MQLKAPAYDGSLGRPLLARLAENALTAAAPLELEVDPGTGLLRRPGDDVPFVERLVDEWSSSSSTRDAAIISGLATLITETPEPADPDLVRASLGLQTTFTKSFEPTDPDLIRPERSSLFALATMITRQAPEDRDPDLIRLPQMRC